MREQKPKQSRSKAKSRKPTGSTSPTKKVRSATKPAARDTQAARITVRTRTVLSGGGVTKLSDAETRLRLILESTTEGHWDWNLQTGEFYYGPGWLSSLGYSDDDLPGDISFWESIIHPDEHPEFERVLQQHSAGALASFDFECRLRAKSGQYKWFRHRGKIIDRSKDGRPLRMVGSLFDISQRRQAVEELARSRAQLSALFEATDDYIFSVRADNFGLLTYNRAFAQYAEKYLKIRVHEGMTLEDLLPPERANIFTGFFRRALEEGELKTDYHLVPAGTTLHLSFHRLMRGDHVFGVSVFGRDITERKRTEEALHKSEEKFAKAFRQSPMALAITSLASYRYIEVNETFEQLSGYSRSEIIGKTPFEVGILVDPEMRHVFVNRLRSEGRLRSIEFQYRTKAGEVRDGRGAAEQIEIDEEPCMLAVIADVTDRKLAETALRDSEERLRLAIQAGKMYAFEWDPKTDQVTRSKESSEILGDEASVLLSGAEFMQRVHPEDREHRYHVVESLNPEQPVYKTTYRLTRHDGTLVWLEDSGRALFDAGGSLTRVVGMTADMTEARQSERALRELSGRLINSQEEERRRVGRELHDSIGQHLALLAIRAQRIDSGEAEAEGTAKTEIHELHRKVKEIATKVAELSHQLHSSELEFLGLAVASERVCREFSKQYGIDIDYEVKSVPRLDKKVALCFYRIIQECLRNVGKHSRAKRVTLDLVGNGNKLQLTIADDGIGFEPEAGEMAGGMGLLSMRERMNLVGGTLSIRSTPGHGTKVTASLQIEPHK